MALSANALTTWATLKDALSLSDDSQQSRGERLIAVSSDLIESYCGRAFAYSDTASERLVPSGTNRLVLTRLPVISVESVEWDGSAVDDYELEDSALGFVWRDGGWPTNDRVPAGVALEPRPGTSQRTIVVSFAGGYVTPAQATAELPRTLPFDLEQACLDTACSLWRRVGSDVSLPDYAAESPLPELVRSVLDRYRVIL